jgi:hypothetical protein
MKTLRYTILLGVLLSTFSPAVRAQLPAGSPLGQPSLEIEVLKPRFDTSLSESFSFFTSATFLTARVPLSRNLLVVAEIPFAHVGSRYTSPSGTASDSPNEPALGNPYLGLSFAPEGANAAAEFGIRLPLAQQSDGYAATAVGALSDVDRLDAFMPDQLSMMVAVRTSQEVAEGLSLRTRLGPTAWVQNIHFDDVELFAQYGAQLHYAAGIGEVGLGVTGRLLITESDLDFGERSVHHLGVVAALNLSRVQPGLQFRVPLDKDLRSFVDHVFGLSLVVRI